MLVIPAAVAFLRHAAPDSGSRLTIMRTLTPSLIIESQIVPNFAVSPPAFWMSEPTPAALNAASRLGRSLFSQRGDVVVSGRITPTVPLVAPLEPPELAELLLLPPQAVSASVNTAPTAARLAHFDVAIDFPSFHSDVPSATTPACDHLHAVCCRPQLNRLG